MGPHVIEGEVIDESAAPSTALATRTNGNGHAIVEWTPRFAISVDQAVEVVKQKRDFMDKVMRKDEHYGVIPGTGTKPALLKPGAELLLSSMGLRPELVDAAPPVEDWTGEHHGGEAFLQYRRACIIWRQTGPGPEDRIFIARAEGSCSSWEKKYRWRQAERVCPVCNQHAIIKGKAEFGGGWLCWKKKAGCGEKFADTDLRITSQESGQVANPDVADLANTILKMADKRAMVAATLVATGCSDIFTQDIEDGADDHDTASGQSGMSGEDFANDHGQTPQAAKPKTRTRTKAGTAPPIPEANSGESPPPAPPTGEIGQVDTVAKLAALLPNTPKTRPEVEGAIKQYGFAAYLKSVVTQHKYQCGSQCPHLAEDGD